jgi:hypothetical protein
LLRRWRSREIRRDLTSIARPLWIKAWREWVRPRGVDGRSREVRSASPFADPDVAARKLVEIANGVEACSYLTGSKSSTEIRRQLLGRRVLECGETNPASANQRSVCRSQDRL